MSKQSQKNKIPVTQEEKAIFTLEQLVSQMEAAPDRPKAPKRWKHASIIKNEPPVAHRLNGHTKKPTKT
jgi:hypothetical protein